MNDPTTTPLDLDALRGRLAAGGPQFWRGLEELAGTPAFEELLHREFPDRASEWTDPVTRRRFLTLLGASLALAGLAGCSQAPSEKIIPYVRQPEGLTPGKPLFFATAMAVGRTVTGLLVESHEGRPTKIEGNPDHPASQGATDSFAQAAVLGLYDPDRSQSVRRLGSPRTWPDAFEELRKAIASQKPGRGSGIRIVTEAVVSPTLHDQLRAALTDYPEAQWIQYEPAESDAALQGAVLALGDGLHTYPDLMKADVILSLDADLLTGGGPGLRNARQFASRRRQWDRTDTSAPMNRLYVVEGAPTCTGAAADHRLRLKPSQIAEFARRLAVELKVPGAADLPTGGDLPEEALAWVGPLARDLDRTRGRNVVVAGPTQPPAVHALVHALNAGLRNVGQTVFHVAWPFPRLGELRTLTDDMNAGRVDVLLIVGGNPAFTAPADVAFADALLSLSRRRGSFTAHLGLYEDETSERCQWHLPEAHFLETWGDLRAFDGTVTLTQPLIAPLYGGKSAIELLEVFRQGTQRGGHDLVRSYWRDNRPPDITSATFEPFWERSLHDGVVRGSALPVRNVGVRPEWVKAWPAPAAASGLEVAFRPDPTIHDGRFANNGWLQELPQPITRVTWDSVALVSPKTAQELGVTTTPGWRGGEHGDMRTDMVRLTLAGRSETFPAWILPGHADGLVTIFFGHGRTRAGRVGSPEGPSRGAQNAFKLRTAAAPWTDVGASLAKTGDRFVVACTQGHHSMEGRNLVRSATRAEYEKHPDFATSAHGHGPEANPDRLLPETPQGQRPMVGRLPLTMYGEPRDYPDHKWGLAIDLSACTGCGACVVACQAENNIPVVGKEEVTRGREMHWLRIDRYFEGSLDDPRLHHQPVPCMHCENAPCEVVCPVEATVHSHDGLNDMIYNRCVGTRYCSNNCPYKVRRFNFLAYADFATPSLKLGRNPEVTVRSRGVMEKCTYCVQRIRVAEVEAERRALAPGGRPEDRRIRDGEVVTACQAVCPAGAIVFGDMNDPQSRVKKMKASPLDYGLLADLNTRPRTTYLAAVRNPNPELSEGSGVRGQGSGKKDPGLLALSSLTPDP